MKDIKGVDDCIKILQESKSNKERKVAVEALRDMGVEARSALDELLKIVNRRDDFIVQGLAEEAVTKIGEPAIPFLKKSLKSISHKKRIKGLSMLGDIALENKKTVDKVLPIISPLALSDINYGVRTEAITLISKFIAKNKEQPEAIALLGKILRNDRNFRIQYEISQILAKINSPLAINEIMKSLNRKSYPFLRFSINPRIEAANALQNIAIEYPKLIKSVIPELLKLLKEDYNYSIRESMILPLLFSRDWDVIEEVFQIVFKDRHWEVRLAALTSATHLITDDFQKEKMKNIIPIIKKIAREDKEEVIRTAAKDLLEDFKEFS